MKKITLGKRMKWGIVAVLFIAAISVGVFSGNITSAWEASTGVYGVEVDNTLYAAAGNLDVDDATSGYPNIATSISSIQHCNLRGEVTPNQFADDVRVVTIDGVDYVFALHYYRFTVKVRTVADTSVLPIETETNRPNPNPVDPTQGLGKAISPTIWVEVSFAPWDAIDGADERWVGVMTVQLLDTRAGVEEGQSEADGGTSADPVLNAGAQLTMYTQVDGSPLAQGNWEGVNPDSTIASNVVVQMTPSLEAGYHDVMGGFFGIQLIDIQAIDVFVAYDVIVEVLIMGVAPNTGIATDWDDNSGKNQTAPITAFQWWNSALGYWGERLDAFGNWGSVFAPILIPVVAVSALVIIYMVYKPRRRGD